MVREPKVKGLLWQDTREYRGQMEQRAKVPGGWLVQIMTSNGQVAMTFVPDPDHTWDGNSVSVGKPKPIQKKAETK